MSGLPQVLTPSGELVRVLTAGDLLAYAGLDGDRLGDAELGELGSFVDNVEHLKRVADEARGIVGDEGIRRLDRKWTRRVDVDGVTFKLEAPSPEAGTTKYDTDLLKAALERLVAEDLIDPEGARGALEEVPGAIELTRDALEAIAGALVSGELERSEVLEDVERMIARVPEATYKQRPAGIKALLKIGGQVAAAIEEAKVDVDPSARRLKVSRVEAKR
jgi:hypothetical protein